MIGFGATHGSHGTVPGTGATGRDGGTHIIVGHMIGTGITAMLSIIITTAALSEMESEFTADTMRCIVT